MPKVSKDMLLKPARKNRIVILEEMNFVFDEPELTEIAGMWQEGKHINCIAKHFDREPDEMLLALLHLSREGKIERRRGGLY
jgi:predicted Rossmann fold nucleotide-binding protein DprA/Smf involved in DNA uptake